MENILVQSNECPIGWKQHIDPLLQWFDFTDHRDKGIVVNQIKEKFGHLRFYKENATDQQNDLITYVEYLCANTCQQCGHYGPDVSTENITGWIYTLCEKCNQKKKDEKKRYHKKNNGMAL